LGGVDDGLLAVSPDGRERWRFRSEYDCSDVCPAVAADGTVYFAAGYATDLPLSRSRGCLYALSPEGTLRWRYKANGSDWSAPSVGADGTIYITAGDDLVAVARHGKRRWSIRLDLLGGADSCPAIDAAGSVYVWGWDFFAVRPTGQGEWRISVEGDSEDTGPAIGTDGTMYVGAEPWYFYAWASRGSVKWRVRIDDGVFSWPAIAADGTVYVGACDNNLYALRPDGSQKWRFPTGGDVRSSPAIGADGTIYVGAKDGSLYAIAPDGKQKWRFQTGGEIWSSPAIGIGSTVYVVSDDQYLYAIN
jgi:outer membrane protein assembly factor BamB